MFSNRIPKPKDPYHAHRDPNRQRAFSSGQAALGEAERG